MIVTSEDNSEKERATRKANSTRLRDCDQFTVTSGRCTRAVYPKKLHKQEAHNIDRTMTANRAESNSPGFQVADNFREAPFTDAREKTPFTKDSLVQVNRTLSTHITSKTVGDSNRANNISIHQDKRYLSTP